MRGCPPRVQGHLWRLTFQQSNFASVSSHSKIAIGIFAHVLGLGLGKASQGPETRGSGCEDLHESFKPGLRIAKNGSLSVTPKAYHKPYEIACHNCELVSLETYGIHPIDMPKPMRNLEFTVGGHDWTPLSHHRATRLRRLIANLPGRGMCRYPTTMVIVCLYTAA